MNIRLTIIVPVYNVERYIERCLSSLLDQDIPQSDYEIIVVDDGTPDNSAVIAQRIADENENITVVHRENGGLSAARNTGMEHVHGRYVFFVDSDDYIEPNVLAILLKSAEERNLELLMFRAYHLDNGKRWTEPIQPFFHDGSVYEGITLIRKGLKITSVWQHFYSAELLNSYGFRFKEGILHEDIEFNYRVFIKARKVGFENTMVYTYNGDNGDSITRGYKVEKKARILMSNLEVAASIKNFIRRENVPEDIFSIYDSRMNSMLISQFYSLIKGADRNQPGAFVKGYLAKAKVLGVYPIKGYNGNRRAKMARCLLNREPLLKLLLKVSRK